MYLDTIYILAEFRFDWTAGAKLQILLTRICGPHVFY
jgi:hypothetical protein